MSLEYIEIINNTYAKERLQYALFRGSVSYLAGQVLAYQKHVWIPAKD